MLIDVNKLALNKRLAALTLEEHIDSVSDKYVYKGNYFTKGKGRHSTFTKDGIWSVVNPKEPENIITQFNFISSKVNYISDMFMLVDYSNDSRRYLIYRDTKSRYIKPDLEGIFRTEYILHYIPPDESKTIYDKFLELKQKLKWGARDVV